MLLFGLVTVRNWLMDYRMTSAQLELLASDRPVVSYGRGRGVTRKGMDDLVRRWKERHGEIGKGVRMDIGEFFRGK